MALMIYDSLTQKKIHFKPIHTGSVFLYVCGITVYDHAHLGHARTLITFDAVVRYLRAVGYRVFYVRNITDIDDKIIHRAACNEESYDALAERFIAAQKEDEIALQLVSPDQEPRATHFIESMIQWISAFLEQGIAYRSENGDVYFSVRSFPNYGQLSHRRVDELRSGARVEIETNKRDSLDFVLWKHARSGEPSWAAPFGAGRPGWHLECSVMSEGILGCPFDVHGGGIDLNFPHHENEMAQSESFTHRHLANVWMHVGLLSQSGQKMSKSLGNMTTIRETRAQYAPEAVRLWILSAHYRSPLSYTESSLVQAQNSLMTLYRALEGLPEVAYVPGLDACRFHAAIEDDFCFQKAVVILFELANRIQQQRAAHHMREAAACAAELKFLGNTLGLLYRDPFQCIQNASDVQIALIEDLVQKRELARAERNWVQSDHLRDQLHRLGIVVEDRATGPFWRKKI